jgi:hypothetical protein
MKQALAYSCEDRGGNYRFRGLLIVSCLILISVFILILVTIEEIHQHDGKMEWALSWIVLDLATEPPDEIFSLSGQKLKIIKMTSCCKLSRTLSASISWRLSFPASGSSSGSLPPSSSDSGIDGAFRRRPTTCGSCGILSSLTSLAVSALLRFVAWAVVLACHRDSK